MSKVNQTMKAITFENFGDATVLKVATRPHPEVKPGEVLIRLSHTSVNPVDWKIRMGFLKDMLPHVFPIIPGWDAAGTVETVGTGVIGFKAGDRVAAYARLPEVHSGTYAEYISLPENFLAKMGESVSFEQAAGVPLVSLTAKQALSDYTKVTKGDRVLILNGAGGVGSFAIQFAKQMGADVTATTSKTNTDYVKGLGADHVIDYGTEDIELMGKKIAPNGFDLVIDAVGGDTLLKAFNIVKKGGQIVSIVDVPNQDLATSKGVNAAFHFVYPNGEQLQSVFKTIEAKATKLPAYTVMPITEAQQAHRASETHRTRGKIVLNVKF